MRTHAPALSVLLVTALLGLACGPSGSAGQDGSVPRPDGTTPPTDGTTPPTDGYTPGPDGASADAAVASDAATDPVLYCAPSCGTAADCNQGSAPYDSDNYACNGGACIYTGCTGDSECQTLGSYLCRQPAGYAMPLCLPACGTATDCNLGSAPYDADNYTCTSGVCVYAGCNSDSECSTLGAYVCRTAPGSSVPICMLSCGTPADCNQGSAPYDADNYDCVNGGCVYQGCNSHAECAALGNYVCASSVNPLPGT